MNGIPYRETRLTYAQRAVLRVVSEGQALNGFDPKSNSYRTAVCLFKRGLLNQVKTSSAFCLTAKGSEVLQIDQKRRDKVRLPELSEELERRNAAAATAYQIVQKFSELAEMDMAPLLMMEIGKALLASSDELRAAKLWYLHQIEIVNRRNTELESKVFVKETE